MHFLDIRILMMEEVSLRYLDFMANTTQCPMKGLVKGKV